MYEVTQLKKLVNILKLPFKRSIPSVSEEHSDKDQNRLDLMTLNALIRIKLLISMFSPDIFIFEKFASMTWFVDASSI